jgi:photosystem II stability/assembly factor-like uncharacterized protein
MASRRGPRRGRGWAQGAWTLLVGSWALGPAGPLVGQDADRVLADLTLREIGPAVMGGRISDLAVNEANPAHFFVGAATGGVWKTTNHGQSWEPVFDEQSTASVGALALAPSNPNVVWVGTGEPQNRQSSPWGDGVFKSMDGGRTWSHMGLRETRHVGAVVIHPRDPDVVYVAAVGHLWGPNPERGVYRTTDGGRAWERVLYLDENTGAIDLVMDPGDPNTLIAAMYQRRRTGWGFSADGPGSGLWRTLDGGDSWAEVTEGLPDGYKGRIGLDIYRRDGNLVYAIVEAREGAGRGIYRSLDRGDSWEKVGDTNPRPMYFSMIRIDPNDPNRIYIGGVRFGVSDDGGKTFEREDGAEGIHVDHHALWIDPANSSHLILGNDGGLATSWDRAETWRQIDNLALGQFYEVGVDASDPYRVCGGLQDNSSWCAPHNTMSDYGIRNGDWIDVSGGDGFYNVIDPADPNVIYTESQGGNISRYDARTGEAARIRPVARPTDADEDREYRFNWNAPIVVSAHEPATVYIGANHLLRSRDRGRSWEEASPDLTRNIDRDTLLIMGAEVTEETLSRNDGIRHYGTITAIGESRHLPGVLFVGTDDGNVQRTDDGGATWTNLTGRFPGLPDRTYVSGIEPSVLEGRVYASFDGHRNDDYAPYVYVSEDDGDSWRPISGGLPDWSVNRVKEHPRSTDLLFVANEVGVYVSLDAGEAWHRLGGLPTVPVDDVEIHPRDNDLVVGTHGRSIWILDDLGVLEALTDDQVLAAETHLYTPRPARQANRSGGWPFWGDEFQGENPPEGVLLRYRLGAGVSTDARATDAAEAGERLAPAYDGESSGGDRGSEPDAEGPVEDGGVSIRLADASGTVVRTLDVPASPGLHRVVWDLRMDPPYEADDQDPGSFGGGARGPLVLPGRYTATLVAADDEWTTDLTVEPDPRIEISAEDRQARHDAVMAVHALAGPFHEAEERVEAAREELDRLRGVLGESDDAAPEHIVEEADSIEAELDALEEDLDDFSPARMRSALEGSTTRPTDDQLWEIDRAWERAPGIVGRVNAVVAERLPALTQLLEDEGLRPETSTPMAMPRRPGR